MTAARDVPFTQQHPEPAQVRVVERDPTKPCITEIVDPDLAKSWGTFIEPDPGLTQTDDLLGALALGVQSGYRSAQFMDRFVGKSPLFDGILERISGVDLNYEDQCSADYYYDVFQVLEAVRGKIDRVAEVGVLMGGASMIFSGVLNEFDFDLDLIDIDPRYLRFVYERIRRTHPGAEKRVRLFWGGLPEYTRHALAGAACKALVHHDGPHYFEPVVKDLSSLYFARDSVHAVMCQDTHLRGRANKLNFVDVALHAVFGRDLVHTPIGARYAPDDALMTNPNQYEGNYFLPGRPEGMVLLLEENHFEYPHPTMQLSEFLGEPPDWISIVDR